MGTVTDTIETKETVEILKSKAEKLSGFGTMLQGYTAIDECDTDCTELDLQNWIYGIRELIKMYSSELIFIYEK